MKNSFLQTHNSPNKCPISFPRGVLSLGLLIFLISCSAPQKNRVEEWITKGNDFFSKHNYSEAVKSWQKALLLAPNNTDVVRKLAKTYILLAENEKAIATFHKLVLLEPQAWGAWLELGNLNLIDLEIKAAEACWEHISRNDEDPRTYIFYGDLLVIKKQIEDAEIAYKKALTITPDHAVATIKLASCYHVQGKEKLAQQVFGKIELLDSKSVEVLIQMSNFAKIVGKYEDTEAYLQKAMALAPHDLGLKQILAEFTFDSEAYGMALEIIDQMILHAPSNIYLKKFRIEILLNLNKMESAKESIDQLSELTQTDLEIQLLKGKYYLFTREFSKALSQFNLVVEKEPNLALVHYLISLTYLAGGQPSLAQTGITQALALDPKFTDAELCLANLYYKREEFELSLEHAQRISEREPENFRAHLIVGHNYLALEKYNEAISQFQIAQKIDPSAVSPAYYVALAKRVSNKENEAIESYRALLNAHPRLINATQDYIMLFSGNG